MTVNTTEITSGPYSGNDVADEFAYTFRVENKNQLLVYETDDDSNETLLTVDTDYTVADLGVDGGGTITRVAGALPTGYTWYIRSNYTTTQDTAFASQGGFFPAIHESAFDKLTFLIQQLYDLNDRTFRLSESDTAFDSESITLPAVADRKSKVLVFDSDGNLTVGNAIGTFRGDWAVARVFNERDLFLDTATNNVYYVLVAHTATTIAADLAAAKIELLVDAEYAKTQADAAAADAIATAADRVQTGLDAAATAADVVQTGIDAAATAADVVLTGLDVAATNADVITVAGIYDDFDDRYLGSKAADPTLDNDGDALITGAIYWNTSLEALRVYNGATWTTINLYTHPNHAGEVTSDGDGAQTLTVAAITNKTALTSGLSATDEVLINDGGVIKRMDVSVLGELLLRRDTTGDKSVQGNPYLAEKTLTDGATINWDFDNGPEAFVTLGGNRTLTHVGVPPAGTWCTIRVKQDGTGNRTLSYSAAFTFGDAGAPVLSTAANASDLLSFRSNNGFLQFTGAALGF